MTEEEIDADPVLSKLPKGSRRRKDLIAGNPGESWWHELPKELKVPLVEHMKNYVRPKYDGTLESFDGPCIWLDQETRLCKHHLHRPNVCRDFETGCGECLQWREVYSGQIKE
ncbi:Flagellin N-methylase [Mariniblastus fucicola]|uniref:Flagellin N-methylase n=2 Tax=Mariniblastus fucicola TaxID=980251 RepID=A0A5B9PCA4_9BACT|nr:Flagellin N-methylase [Mariniblastus fucicola]